MQIRFRRTRIGFRHLRFPYLSNPIPGGMRSVRQRPQRCGVVPIRSERDGREGRNGGGVTLGTSCSVRREEISGWVWVGLGVRVWSL